LRPEDKFKGNSADEMEGDKKRVSVKRISRDWGGEKERPFEGEATLIKEN